MARLVWGPTYEEMLHPEKIAPDIRERALSARERDPLDPLNLYNITWKNSDGTPYYMVLPRELTGVQANIVALYSKDFPTGSHKVGATYSVTMETQLAGEIHPGPDTLVFPSTGNYGIGGAWVGTRMGYDSVVVLPEQMSKERFELIERYGGRCVKTKGCESSVREIYEECKRLAGGPHLKVLNQFEVMANYRFHYYVTGNTAVELVRALGDQGIGDGTCGAFVSAMGSGGTIAAGDRLKEAFPRCLIVGLEPIQCSTLYNNGYGDHDIQGIGDKHVTWIHNVMNMDCLMCVDDIACKKGLQLLTDPVGMEYLSQEAGIDEESVRKLSQIFGISGVCNLLGAIKAAKYYGMGRESTLVTICTDAIDRYHTVMKDLDARFGILDTPESKARLHGVFHDAGLDYIQEGTVNARDRWFNLKYYTWVEQQGKPVEDLDAQRSRSFWDAERAKVQEVDRGLAQARRT